jgi:hypothetical protein
MRRTSLILKGITLLLFSLATIISSPEPAFAQAIDQEFNNSCATAQNVGAITSGLVIKGSLDSTPDSGDVDFFRITGPAGTDITVELEGQATGKGTLFDPLLGIFNSNCNLVAFNNNNGTNLNSSLRLNIPFDGVLILAVTGCCDSQFLGGSVGSYELSVAPTVTANSISGRLVDAVTGIPLPGGVPTFSFVQLFRCSNSSCFNFVNSQTVNNQGEFRFDRDFSGNFLLAGTYQIVAVASQYQERRTEQFTVGANEDKNLGNVTLASFPVRFSEVRPCGALPPEGGECVYSVRVTNGLPASLDGTAWSIVEGFNTGAFVGFTRFQPQNPQNLNIGSGKSRVVEFRFQVPSTVANGATICPQVFVGRGRDGFFDTVGQRSSFCITKGFVGFFLMSEEEAHMKLRHLTGTPPVIPERQKK